MSDDEKFVREYWNSMSISDWYEGKNCAVQAWSIQLYRWTSGVGNTIDDAEMWSQAAEFTRDRLDQIRLVEEEIKLLEWMFLVAILDSVEHPSYGRIIAREQAALVELKKGMK